MRNRELITDYLDNIQQALQGLDVDEIETVASVLVDARLQQRRIFIVGNGGSASTASHFACDLSKGAMRDDHPVVRAQALGDNLAVLTAWANDVHYDEIFSSQISSLVAIDDVVVAISTSGTSKNVIRAVEAARAVGAITVGFAGPGGVLKDCVDYCVSVPNERVSVIEDVHMALTHLLTYVLLRANGGTFGGATVAVNGGSTKEQAS